MISIDQTDESGRSKQNLDKKVSTYRDLYPGQLQKYAVELHSTPLKLRVAVDLGLGLGLKCTAKKLRL